MIELHAELEEFIAAAERLTAAARELLRPRATTPAKAQLQRYVMTKPSNAKT